MTISHLILLALCLGCAGCSLTNPSDFGEPAALEDARVLWDAIEPSRYELRIKQTCDCDTDGAYLVTVEQDQITAVLKEGVATDLASGVTVDGLFDRLEEAYQTSALILQVNYHPVSGYPQYARLSRIPGVSSGEIIWDIQTIRALPS